MRASPTRLVIEPLLVALDAFPTNKVLAAVRSDEFNHMISNSIATLATLYCLVFGHFFSQPYECGHYQPSLAAFQDAAV
jgi:hypothetical protein